MTKAEIVTTIVESTGLKRATVQSIVEEFMECVKDSLSKDENVYLRDFGNFTVKIRAKKLARNISKNKTIVVPVHKTPAFKPAASFFVNQCEGCISKIEIPDSETEIKNFAYQSRTDLRSVVIGKSVTKIGNFAFQGCRNLTDIVIPEGLTNIGNNAFKGCTKLSRIALPDSVTEIRRSAFADCVGLEHFVIPGSISMIRRSSYSGCTNMKSITIPNSVSDIGEYAFQGCTSLTSIVIPDSVTSIGRFAFAGCTGLTSVVIGNSVKKIDAFAFTNCPGIRSIVFGNSVKKIGESAFQDCEKLTSLNLGHSVRKIGDKAFFGCNELKSIVIPSSVIEIGNYTFPTTTLISKEPDSKLILKKMNPDKLEDLIQRANRKWAEDTCLFIEYDQNDYDDDDDSPFTWEEITENTGILHVEMFPPTNDDIINIMEEMVLEEGEYIKFENELKAHKITEVLDLDAINRYIVRYFNKRTGLPYYFTSADVSKGEFEYRNIS